MPLSVQQRSLYLRYLLFSGCILVSLLCALPESVLGSTVAARLVNSLSEVTGIAKLFSDNAPRPLVVRLATSAAVWIAPLVATLIHLTVLDREALRKANRGGVVSTRLVWLLIIIIPFAVRDSAPDIPMLTLVLSWIRESRLALTVTDSVIYFIVCCSWIMLFAPSAKTEK
jgi:hypothetical protein